MSFSIPVLNDLVPEQLDIINLPTDRDWVIQGGPGTGKTVMAILRANQISTYKKVVILVYNRPLKLFLEKAVKNTNCDVKTYNEWIADMYLQCFGKTSFPHEAQFVPNYSQIERELKNVGIIYDHIIIDEAQDCPMELVRTIQNVSANITCFIDPNQEIFNNKTSPISLIKALCIEAPYTLTKNFRNTKEIRDVSSIFCQDGIPAMSFVPGNKPTLVKCDDFDAQVDYICNFCINNRENTIGIIVNSIRLNRTFSEIYDRLGSIMPVQMYKTMVNTNFDFSRPGVQIFSYGTMKGLEFDHVIIPNIDMIRNDSKSLNQLYVAISRARKDLKLTYFRNYCTSKWLDTFSIIDRHKDLFNWEVY